MIGNFEIITALLVLNIIVSVATLTMVIVLLTKKRTTNNNSVQPVKDSMVSQTIITQQSHESGVVFCRNCGNQYDSSVAVCPHCKTPH